MKARLDEARSESALLDTTGFARDLESLHGRIWDEHCTGRQEIIGPVGWLPWHQARQVLA